MWLKNGTDQKLQKKIVRFQIVLWRTNIIIHKYGMIHLFEFSHK